MKNIKIEKGIPIPGVNVRSPWVELLKKMGVGDSILVMPNERVVVYNVAKRMGMKVATRKEGHKVRVWRTK